MTKRITRLSAVLVITLALLVGSTMIAHAEYPGVSWADSTTNAPIYVHTNGDLLRDWQWSCDDESDEFPLEQRCRVYDFTLGNLNSGNDLLLVDADCGVANSDPTTVNYSYDVPAPDLQGGHRYAYAAYCRDSSTNPGPYSFTLWRWFWFDDVDPTVAIADGPSTTSANPSTTANFQLTCDEDSYDYDFGSVNYDPYCELWCALFDNDSGAVISAAQKCDGNQLLSTSEFGSHTYTDLPKGNYRFEVYGRDRVGNTSSTQTWVFEVDPPDSDPPDTEITSNPAPVTNSTSAVFDFICDEPNCTFQCTITNGSGTVIFDDACVSGTSFNMPGDGNYTFTVLATDASGNADTDPNNDTVSTYSWTIDTSAPQTDINAGCPQGFTNSNSISLEFSCPDGNCDFTCTLTRDGQVIQTVNNCTSPVTFNTTEDGDYEIAVTAADSGGNADPSPALCVFKRDTSPPETCIASGPAELGSQNSGLQFDLECEPDTEDCTYVCEMYWKRPDGTLELKETEDPCNDGTTWSVSDATFVLIAYATDSAGNTDSDSTTNDPTCAGQWEFTVDTTPPPDPTIDTPGIDVNDCEPLISGETEAGATVTITVDGQIVATVVADEDGKYEYQVPEGDCWTDGQHTIGASAADSLGNVSNETNKPVNVAHDEDKDGISDAIEDANGNGSVDAGETDPNNPDTDGDGLCDGNTFVDGVCQNGEDKNVNGQVDPGETDPTDPDTDDGGVPDGVEVLDNGTDPLDPADDQCVTGTDCDGDGLSDLKEGELGTDKFDADSDDDGLSDGDEYYTHLTNPNNPDSDGDGIQDGTELGVRTAGDGTDENVFVPDADTTSTTDPNNPDSDGDRLCDGSLKPQDANCIAGEDMNNDGNVDATESDPNLLDTDGGGVGDGDEVIDQQGPSSGNPLDADDDYPFILSGSGPVACSGGSPVDFWPVALAMFLLVVVRRRG